jgi:cation diffusion facilitator family transporter
MSNFRFQFYILIAGLGVAAFKFYLYYTTKSNAIFSDALESLVNISANTITLYSLYLSAKPRDKTHPYGHGKIEFLAAGIEGGLLFAAGVITMVKSGIDYLNQNELKLSSITLGALLGLGFANYALGIYSERKGKKNQSPALLSSGQHLKGDGYTTLGILISLVIAYFTKWQWIDTIIGITAGMYIIYQGIKVMKTSILDILGTADEAILDKVIRHLQKCRKNAWIDIHNLRILKFGAEYHLDAHVTLPYYYTNQEVHNEMKEMHQFINQHFNSNVELFIHPDPCEPFCCEYCHLENCVERNSTFKQTIEWTLDNVLRDEKHAPTENKSLAT